MTATLRIILTTIIACCILPWVEASSCPPGMLAVYRLNLATEWSEEKFPKQYPQWRPPAQWSKTVGQYLSDRFLQPSKYFLRIIPPCITRQIVRVTNIGIAWVVLETE